MNIKKLGPTDLAIDLLRRSACKVRMAAVISDRHGIYAWGWNHSLGDYSMHAEIHALSRSNPSRRKDSTITVAGERAKSGNVVLSRPCEDCLTRLKTHGILSMRYQDKEGNWWNERV